MTDPYDFHPNHPANETDPVFVHGYICPNQFSDDRFEGVDLGQVDEQLDIDEAKDLARSLANRFNMKVAVEISDEDGWHTETRRFGPKKN